MIKINNYEKKFYKTIIKREYLEKLDKELEIIPITFDQMFKSVFGKNLELKKRYDFRGYL